MVHRKLRRDGGHVSGEPDYDNDILRQSAQHHDRVCEYELRSGHGNGERDAINAHRRWGKPIHDMSRRFLHTFRDSG